MDIRQNFLIRTAGVVAAVRINIILSKKYCDYVEFMTEETCIKIAEPTLGVLTGFSINVGISLIGEHMGEYTHYYL